MGVSRKQSTPNFPKNEHFLPLDMQTYVCVSWGKKCSFFGKFGVLCFLETSVLRFALLPYYPRNTDILNKDQKGTKYYLKKFRRCIILKELSELPGKWTWLTPEPKFLGPYLPLNRTGQ